MRHIVFVRHSLPEIQESLDRKYWRLSQEGHRRAEVLAGELFDYDIEAIITSNEIKAIETANTIGNKVNQTYEIDDRIREHDIGNERFLQEPAFKRLVDSLFQEPDSVVFGEESASDAARRFGTAVEDARGKYQTGDIVMVSHGRVLCAYLAPSLEIDPFELWKKMKAPALIAFSLPDLELTEMRLSIE